MQDPIEAWVDTAALRRMGEQLVRPNRGVADLQHAPETSRAGEQPCEANLAGRHLAHARALADRSGVLSNPAATAGEPMAPLTRIPLGPGPLLGRLTAYRDWLHDEVGVQAFFLLDADGDVIADETGHEGLRQLALRVARSSAASGGLDEIAGHLRVQVSPEQQLVVIPAVSPMGPIILGLVVRHALSAAAAKTVAEGLQRAVAPASPA